MAAAVMPPEVVWMLIAVCEASAAGAFVVLMTFGFMSGKFISVIGAKALCLNPLSNKRMEILKMDDSELAYSKKRGYFFVNPEHVYTESKSGKPIFIAPSILGKTVDPQRIKFIDSLKGLGIRSYDNMLAMFTKDGKLLEEIETTVQEKGKDGKMHDVTSTVKVADIMLSFGGQSIPLNNIIEYFSQQMPAEVTEARINYKIAVEEGKKKKHDYMMWIVALCMILVCGALALAILSIVMNSSGGGGIDFGALQNAVQKGVEQTQPKVVTPSTGIG